MKLKWLKINKERKIERKKEMGEGGGGNKRKGRVRKGRS